MSDSGHAYLSCSGAHRWMACPGSPHLEAQFPRQDSVYAIEGTTAHTLLETALLLGETQVEACTALVEGADAEMAEHLQPVLDWILIQMAERPGAELFTELKVRPGRLIDRDDLWGTADVLILDPERAEIVVGDLKYGAGHAVEADGNVQLRLYALGAVGLAPHAERITTAILQPRAIHAVGPVRTETLTREELLAFAETIKAAAQATDEDAAPLAAGDHCTFCRAAGGCSVLADLSLSVAREAFRAVEGPLSPERVGELLRQAGMVRSWLKALEGHALRLAREGTPVPGFKLANRRGHRAWINPEAALEQLTATYDVGADLLAVRTLVSPAQAEKAIKAATKKKPDLSALVQVPELGSRLVPDGAPGCDPFAEALELFAGLEEEIEF